MDYTRREFGKLALAGLPAAAFFDVPAFGAALLQAKPNSLFHGVQIGTITYSYRQLPDQSAEATLKYIVDSGISAIELMGGPVESFAGAPSGRRGGGAGGGAAGGGAPGGAPGGRAGGGGGGRGAAAGGPPAASPAPPTALDPNAPSWNGQPCATGRGGGGGGAVGGGGARGGGLVPPSASPAAPAVAAPPQGPAPQDALKAWRTSVSMDVFKKLRKMYNDAGVTIYAWKQLTPNMSDEEFEYIFNVAEALGCTHTTLELPTGANAAAQLKRVGDFAMKKKIYAAYHTHTQGSMSVFDEAFAASKGNMANIDLGHYVAGGNVGGTTLQFLEKFHDRISSVHLKDRTTPAHCALNLPWGTGETPIKEILQLMRKNRWKFPASIELEYSVPEGSDPVKEVKKCVEYCKAALA
jgi:sugar phosphate isomerase/epimerase